MSISIVSFHVRLKTRLRRPFWFYILINRSDFQLIALKPGIYGVTASGVFECLHGIFQNSY